MKEQLVRFSNFYTKKLREFEFFPKKIVKIFEFRAKNEVCIFQKDDAPSIIGSNFFLVYETLPCVK